MPEFGVILYKVMIDKGIRPVQLARGVGVDLSQISRWYSGKTKPSGENMLKIARFLNIPVETLTGEDDPFGDGKYRITTEEQRLVECIYVVYAPNPDAAKAKVIAGGMSPTYQEEWVRDGDRKIINVENITEDKDELR